MSVKRGRKRRIAGWLLLLAGVCVACVSAVSIWACPHLALGDYRFAVHRGLVHVVFVAPYVPPPAAGAASMSMPQLIESERVRRVDQFWGKIARGGEQPGWMWNWEPRSMNLMSNLAFVSPGSVPVTLPVWRVIVIVWAAGAMLFAWGEVARRGKQAGACRGCGYSLAGLAEGAACPECGKGAAR